MLINFLNQQWLSQRIVTIFATNSWKTPVIIVRFPDPLPQSRGTCKPACEASWAPKKGGCDDVMCFWVHRHFLCCNIIEGINE